MLCPCIYNVLTIKEKVFDFFFLIPTPPPPKKNLQTFTAPPWDHADTYILLFKNLIVNILPHDELFLAQHPVPSGQSRWGSTLTSPEIKRPNSKWYSS